MSPWNACLLRLYYYGSYPYRWWRNRRAQAEHRAPLVVLFYHRIADDRANDWTTSNRAFARQIAWLAGHFELVSLAEVQKRIRGRDNSRPCASITFDDGYADNCRQAISLLVKERIPCTYFVTVRNVLSGEPFPHDLAQEHRCPPNNLEQLRAMSAAGIEIASHGFTHIDLGGVTDAAELYAELVTSKHTLERLLDRPIRYFAFPFGQHANLSARAMAMARQAGYQAVCSAYGGYNFPGGDPFHLQRIHVDESMIRLKNRATVDPRKLDVPRFSETVRSSNTPHDVQRHRPTP